MKTRKPARRRRRPPIIDGWIPKSEMEHRLRMAKFQWEQAQREARALARALDVWTDDGGRI
jgi:hypothetical protein